VERILYRAPRKVNCGRDLTPNNSGVSEPESRWAADGEEAKALRRRSESLWNRDYFERVVVPLLDVREGGEVLDVGTGLGALAFLLQSVRPDLSVTGVDSEEGLIDEANLASRSLGLDRMRFEVGEAGSLPYTDRAFDLVMCQTLLAHVPDSRVVIAEMARVLRAGGVFFAAEWTDRALSALPVDNVLTRTVANDGEIYRLTRPIAKAAVRSDGVTDEAGLRAALNLHEEGLEVLDVRYSDRLWHAVPPYAKQTEQEWVGSARDWTSAPVDAEYAAWVAENLAAAGGTQADVERFFELTESDADKRRWGAAIEAGRFAVVSTVAMILTVARKPLATDR